MWFSTYNNIEFSFRQKQKRKSEYNLRWRQVWILPTRELFSFFSENGSPFRNIHVQKRFEKITRNRL